MYNIFEAHIEFNDRKLHRVTVLVEISKGDVRAIYVSDAFRPYEGYEYFDSGECVSDALLQKVAAGGRTLQITARDKLFSGWRRKYGYPPEKRKI